MIRNLFKLLLFLPFLANAQSRITVQAGSSGSGGISQSTLNDTSSAIRSSIPSVSIGAQRTVVHVENDNYSQSPIAFKTADGWTYLCSNESAQHTGTGIIKLRRSKDGTNWSESWTVSVPGFDTLGVPSWGANGNRIFVKFLRVTNQTPIYTKSFYATFDVVDNDTPDVFTLRDSTGLPRFIYL